MLEGLTDKLQRWKVNENQIWLESVDREVQFEIIRLNTVEQLFKKGIQSDGSSLVSTNRSPGYYSPTTESMNKGVNFTIDGITKQKIAGDPYFLFDTGHFYASFVVLADRKAIVILADDVYNYDKPLSVEYGSKIIGLTKENMGVLSGMLLKKYIKEIRKRII